MTDKEVLEKCCKKSGESMFRILFDRYWDILYTQAIQHVDEEDAKDILQELMLEVWNNRFRLKTDVSGTLKGYLFTLLKYRIIDFANARPDNVFWDDLIPQLLHLVENNVYDDIIVKELLAIIDNTLQAMSPSEQEVFRLRWQENYSVEATAEMLNISTQSVMNRLNKALKLVRHNVREYYGNTLSSSSLSLLLVIVTGSISG